MIALILSVRAVEESCTMSELILPLRGEQSPLKSRSLMQLADLDVTFSPYCPCVFTIARTNIDDPINSLDVDGSLDPDCIYGPTEWRIQHSQELEETYAESQALCHVRLLDWLQVRYARQVPKFQASDICPSFELLAELTKATSHR